MVCLIFLFLFFQVSETPIRLRAQRKRLLLRKNLLILWDDVEIEQGNIRFLADAACVRLAEDGRPLRFYAEGGVVITDGKRFFFADAIWYDFTKEQGRMRNGHAWLPLRKTPLRIHITAKSVRTEKGLRRVSAANSVVSDCAFGRPHWGLRSRLITIDETGSVRAEGNSLFLGPLSIPAPPLQIEKDWWFPIRRLSFSHRTNFGGITSLIVRLWQGSGGFERSYLVVEGRWERASLRGDGGGFKAKLKVRSKTLPTETSLQYFEFHDKGELRGLWKGPPLRRYADIQFHINRRNYAIMFRHCDMSDNQILSDFFPTKNREAEPQRSFFLSHLHTTDMFARVYLEWSSLDFADTYLSEPELEMELFNLVGRLFLLDLRAFWERSGLKRGTTSGGWEEIGRRVGVGLRLRRALWVGPLNFWLKGEGEGGEYSGLFGLWERLSGFWGEFEVGFGTVVWRRYAKGLLHIIEPRILWRRRWASRTSEAAADFLPDWGATPENILSSRLSTALGRHFTIWLEKGYEISQKMPLLLAHGEWSFNLFSLSAKGGYELRRGYEGWRKGWLDVGGNTRIRAEWIEFRNKRLINMKTTLKVQNRWTLGLSWQYDLKEKQTNRVGFLISRLFHCFLVEVAMEWDSVGGERSVSIRVLPLSVERRTKRIALKKKNKE